MKLKKLPPQCIAPLRLKEITLHGIGSYYKPARLEIKPLTILCGTNGSGKSTWMKVLSVLKEASEDANGKANGLDFLERLNAVVINHALINATLCRISLSQEDGWNTYSGPLGSFAITLTCAKSVSLTRSNTSAHDAGVSDVLKKTELRRGTGIRLRFTQYQLINDEGQHFTTMKGRLSIDGEYVGGSTIKGEGNSIVPVYYEGVEKHESPIDPVDWNTVDKECHPIRFVTDSTNAELTQQIEEIVRLFCGGLFKISAIRPLVTINEEGIGSSEEYNQTAKKIGRSRYVGEGGEHTHFFRSYFGLTPVFDPRKGRSYCATEEVGIAKEIENCQPHIYSKEPRVNGSGMLNALSLKSDPVPDLNNCCLVAFSRPYFWNFLQQRYAVDVLALGARFERLPKRVKDDERVRDFLMEFYSALSSGDFRTCTPPPHEAIIKAMWDLFKILKTHLLLRPDFFRWFLKGFIAKEIDCANFAGLENGAMGYAWISFLASLPEDELADEEVTTLNEWALSLALGIGKGIEEEPTWGFLPQRIGLRCQTLFDWWAYHLLNVDSGVSSWWVLFRSYLGNHELPVGYLASRVPSERDSEEIWTCQHPYTNDFLRSSGIRFEPCGAYPPGHFSAGLHQVTPILVQMNMMRMNEVLAVENPEVHLHPGLQLKFMEFFIENALIGKFSLIETHSDLMIRRVMRAITEEKLPQSWVNISFVSTQKADGEGDIWTSKVEPLKIEDGVISNWPEGFLDDDEKETKALMRALYGDRFTGEEEEVDHE